MRFPVWLASQIINFNEAIGPSEMLPTSSLSGEKYYSRSGNCAAFKSKRCLIDGRIQDKLIESLV